MLKSRFFCKNLISFHISDSSSEVDNFGNKVDEKDVLERGFGFGPTFHRNDSFNKAVNGEEEEEEENEEEKKSVALTYF